MLPFITCSPLLSLSSKNQAYFTDKKPLAECNNTCNLACRFAIWSAAVAVHTMNYYSVVYENAWKRMLKSKQKFWWCSFIWMCRKPIEMEIEKPQRKRMINESVFWLVLIKNNRHQYSTFARTMTHLMITNRTFKFSYLQNTTSAITTRQINNKYIWLLFLAAHLTCLSNDLFDFLFQHIVLLRSFV